MKKGFFGGKGNEGDRIEVTEGRVHIRDGNDEITVRRGSDGSRKVTIIDTGLNLNYGRILIGSAIAAIAIVGSIALGAYTCSLSPAQSANAIRMEYAPGKSPLENKVAQNAGAVAGGVESRLGLMGNAGQGYESSQMSR